MTEASWRQGCCSLLPSKANTAAELAVPTSTERRRGAEKQSCRQVALPGGASFRIVEGGKKARFVATNMFEAFFEGFPPTDVVRRPAPLERGHVRGEVFERGHHKLHAAPVFLGAYGG